MIHDQDWAEHVAAWQRGQAAFWSGAAGAGGMDGFTPEAMGAADAWIFQRLSAPGSMAGAPDTPALAELALAVTALQRMITRTWEDVTADFCASQSSFAMAAEGWVDARALWFRTAEQAFLAVIRRPAYVAAQARVLRALGRAWDEMPTQMQALARESWQAWQTGSQTVQRLTGTRVAIAQTPGDVIWQSEKTTLTRYRPMAPARPGPPILIAHGLIGRQTMTDLVPERSLVRRLLAAGLDLYVVDWGNAGPEDADHGLDHYAGRQLGGAIDACLAHAHRDRLILFGICQGGTLAAAHAARFPDRLAGLITAVAPIDFHAAGADRNPAHGLLNLWMRALSPEDIDRLIALDGNMPGPLLGALFDLMNPVKTLRKYTVDLFQQSPDELRLFLAMERWIADRPDLPGALARTWLVDLYQQNALARGTLSLAGQPVDLSAITVPVLNVYATRDHIIPPPCARALGRFIPVDRYREQAMPTGHIGTFVSSRAQPILAPAIVEWLDTIS